MRRSHSGQNLSGGRGAGGDSSKLDNKDPDTGQSLFKELRDINGAWGLGPGLEHCGGVEGYGGEGGECRCLSMGVFPRMRVGRALFLGVGDCMRI